jgi:hypothetical protein
VSGSASSQLGGLVQIRRKYDNQSWYDSTIQWERINLLSVWKSVSGDMQGFLFFSGPALSLRFERIFDPQPYCHSSLITYRLC